jgi:hypothetical protein
VSVAELPTQIPVGVELAVIVGVVLTTRETVLVLLHDPVVPVTVYTVVDAGDTVTALPVKEPGNQV